MDIRLSRRLFFFKKVVKHFSPKIYFSWKDLIKAEKKNKFLINIKRDNVNRTNFKKRLIIGSANFTQKYGATSN